MIMIKIITRNIREFYEPGKHSHQRMDDLEDLEHFALYASGDLELFFDNLVGDSVGDFWDFELSSFENLEGDSVGDFWDFEVSFDDLVGDFCDLGDFELFFDDLGAPS